MSLYKEEYKSYRRGIIKKLQKVDSIRKTVSRRMVKEQLPEQLRQVLADENSEIDAVTNLVECCCNYENGFFALFDVIEAREGKSTPVKKAWEYWRTAHWKVTLIELLPQAWQSAELTALYNSSLLSAHNQLATTASVDRIQVVEKVWGQRNPQTSQREPLVRFVLRLRQKRRDDETIEDASAEIDQFLADIAACPTVDGVDGALIAHCQQARANTLAALFVRVNAYDPNDRNAIDVQLYEAYANGQYKPFEFHEPAPTQLHKLPPYIENVVAFINERDEQKPPRIDLFLPRKLMREEWNDWFEQRSFQKMVRGSAAVVRFLERQTKRDNEVMNARDLWRRRWQKVDGQPLQAENIRFLAQFPDDIYDFEEQLQVDDDVLCVIVAIPELDEQQMDKLLYYGLLTTGVPVALWARRDGAVTADEFEELRDEHSADFLAYFGDQQRRRNATTGRNTALLWDDATQPSSQLGFQSHAQGL